MHSSVTNRQIRNGSSLGPSVILLYLLAPWCRILFEKLFVTQLVKKILLSYGTRRFITIFTQGHHWTLSLAS